jgi:hypothetical protein
MPGNAKSSSRFNNNALFEAQESFERERELEPDTARTSGSRNRPACLRALKLLQKTNTD